ncbi:MAG: cytochrome C [Rhodospirillaceae bacterium]
MITVALALAVAPWPAGPARAAGAATQPANEVVHKECGACHIAYLPRFLPATAWTKLFDSLDNHYGEDASMPPEVSAVVRHYYLDHAAGLYWTSPSTKDIPRITAQAWWKRAMGKLDVSTPRIRSRANCGACHTHADWYMGVR